MSPPSTDEFWWEDTTPCVQTNNVVVKDEMVMDHLPFPKPNRVVRMVGGDESPNSSNQTPKKCALPPNCYSKPPGEKKKGK
jgi:hypothetical protein